MATIQDLQKQKDKLLKFYAEIINTLVMKQVRFYHDELNIEGNFEQLTGWLQTFKT
ncbi:hypothetical protein AAY473_015302 [Plecturocebus cupreus]